MNKLENKSSNNYQPIGEVDLMEIFNIIWESKIFIVIFTTIFALITILYSLNIPNYYTSKSVVIARDSQNQSSFSQYSGLASLAGVSIPSSNDRSVHEVIEIIQSREFVKHLIKFDKVLPSIIAAESYETSSQKLYFDPEVYDANTETWTREPSINRSSRPSHLEAHKQYIDNMLSLSLDQKKGLIFIEIEHISPIFAKNFLELVIREANSLNKAIDIDSSSKALNYLKAQLAETSLVEIKKSINQLIEAQLETQMMASIHDEYSLISLEPPFVPEDKTRPSRSFMVIVGSLLGGLLSVFFVLMRYFLFNKGTENT
tara:strand:+ start:413 stop:1360 length:948 start_codon:yes stop_codon:yes gene_type:complete